jgi:hypothetical protein
MLIRVSAATIQSSPRGGSLVNVIIPWERSEFELSFRTEEDGLLLLDCFERPSGPLVVLGKYDEEIAFLMDIELEKCEHEAAQHGCTYNLPLCALALDCDYSSCPGACCKHPADGRRRELVGEERPEAVPTGHGRMAHGCDLLTVEWWVSDADTGGLLYVQAQH